MSHYVFTSKLPDPGALDPYDIDTVETYVDNANDYLNTNGIDMRLAIYEKPIAIVFQLTESEWNTYQLASDAEKAIIYQNYIDGIQAYPPIS